jgi:hypothetical protein
MKIGVTGRAASWRAQAAEEDLQPIGGQARADGSGLEDARALGEDRHLLLHRHAVAALAFQRDPPCGRAGRGPFHCQRQRARRAGADVGSRAQAQLVQCPAHARGVGQVGEGQRPGGVVGGARVQREQHFAAGQLHLAGMCGGLAGEHGHRAAALGPDLAPIQCGAAGRQPGAEGQGGRDGQEKCSHPVHYPGP